MLPQPIALLLLAPLIPLPCPKGARGQEYRDIVELEPRETAISLVIYSGSAVSVFLLLFTCYLLPVHFHCYLLLARVSLGPN